jgi:excisionase family DNA binding protein
MPSAQPPQAVVSVETAASALGVSPRTIRRWLQAGYLPGLQVGTSWGVYWWSESVPLVLSPRVLHRRLRQVGTRLIVVGNRTAGTERRRGALFLTWRTPQGLQITFALGRHSPTKGWAPHALGTELPFWLQERSRWHRVMPPLRWYERLRGWCHPRLLRVPGVGDVVLAEIVRLESALRALESPEVHAEEPTASSL